MGDFETRLQTIETLLSKLTAQPEQKTLISITKGQLGVGWSVEAGSFDEAMNLWSKCDDLFKDEAGYKDETTVSGKKQKTYSATQRYFASQAMKAKNQLKKQAMG